MTIRTVTDHERGCGWRKEGGLYMMGGEIMIPRSCLPVKLDVCPVCHHGIKPTRGWTWVQPKGLMEPCKNPMCVLSALPERAGLLWVGEKFYPTPHDFLVEAAQQGISRRITAIPKDFKVGETLVLFAHRKVVMEPLTGGSIYKPGIFSAFIPNRVEYVVKKGDSTEKLESLEKRGVQLVEVVRAGEPLPLGV